MALFSPHFWEIFFLCDLIGLFHGETMGRGTDVRVGKVFCFEFE